MMGVLIVILVGIWLFWTPSRRTYPQREFMDLPGIYGADVSGSAVPAQVGTPLKSTQHAPKPQTSSSQRPFNQPTGELPGARVSSSTATGKCQNPQAPEPQPAP